MGRARQRGPARRPGPPGACATLAIVGGRDRWTPEADIEALQALPDVEVILYPQADHGFVHDPSRPAHRADDAADAWARVAQFLAEREAPARGLSGPGGTAGPGR